MNRSIWQPPRLRIDEEEHGERRATWLELFYDLIFVVAIAELSHYLKAHFSFLGFLEFSLLFVPVWWCWIGATFYATRFDTDDLSDRLTALIQMAIIAVMAANIHHGLSESSVGFALSYIAFRGMLIGQYINAGYHIPQARSLTTWYSIGFSASIVLWLASIFVPIPWRFLLWGLGVVVDFITPLTAGKLVAKIPPSMSHITERIGLFTIIVLGESVVAVVQGVAQQDWNFDSVVMGLLGLTMAFSFWWLYFDSVDGSPLEAMKAGKMHVALFWLYIHLPFVIALAATAVGVEYLISHDLELSALGIEKWLLCASASLALTILAIFHWTTCNFGKTKYRRVVSFYRLGSVAFILSIAAISSYLSPVVLMVLLSLACNIQVFFDLLNTRSQSNF